jgi:hypothetical protein
MSKNELLRERAAVKRDERRRKRKDALRHKDLAFIFETVGGVLWILALIILAISMWHIQYDGFMNKGYVISAVISETYMWMFPFMDLIFRKAVG